MAAPLPPLTRRTLLRNLVLGSAACAAGGLELGIATSAQAAGRKLPRNRPEALGIDPAAVLAFVDAVEQKVGGLHSFILLRHGQVAAEGWWAPYAPQHPHMLFSLSKSFTSTALGLAVTDGRLTVDAPVTSFFPDALPAKVSDNLAAMRVRHLLTMSTGHEKDATGPTVSAADGNWVRAFLATPVERAPGSLFVYNSAATYMLSAIVQKLTGKTVLDNLKPRLFDPLGIENATWETCPKGINTGGWGLSIKTEDIARFGQLYLHHGRWGDRQLVPEAWVNEATTKQISNGDPVTGADWNQGYGYQFWRCRHGAFRGDGAFGQFCIVMPEQDAVLAITSGVGDMQAVLTAAWDHLLPGMQAAPLTANTADAEFKKRLSSLAVRPPAGAATAPIARDVSGKAYRFDANEEKLQSLVLAFEGSRCRITRVDEQGTHRLDVGADGWTKGTVPSDGRTPAKAAARGAWTDENTYTVTLCLYETPFIVTNTYRFEGDGLTVRSRTNVGFGPTERPALVGHRATG